MLLQSQEQKDPCHGVEVFPALNKLVTKTVLTITLHRTRYLSVAMFPPTYFYANFGIMHKKY